METTVYNQSGQESGKMKIPEAVFGLSWNADLVHQVVVSMNSSARHSIANTKTRGEVSGGGKKPWQQKGTGRARHGSTRSPIWVGGGIAHGPRADKNYDRKINKKAKTKALYTILSKKFKDGEVLFVDSIAFSTPKTALAKSTLLGFSKIKGFEKFSTKPKNVAIVSVDKKTPTLIKSFQNIGNVEVEEFRNINPVSVLNHKYLVIANPKELFNK
ncbi:MAG: 50S ribosomal protein L4 [Candidatus Taylorbacteria bacterium]|nr:50S ribosomal protein L4 [Candidatus Taylorbacteria bacterium]